MVDSGSTQPVEDQGTSLLPAERHKLILEVLMREGTIQLSRLQKILPVSLMTIRRDLAHLERQGLLKRLYGCAVTETSTGYEPPFAARKDRYADEKAAIGRAAAELVRDGERILVDTGTTVMQLARHLGSKQDLKVLTASIPVATELARHPNLHVTLLAGTVRHSNLALVGRLAECVLGEYYADKAFTGLGGLDLERGLTTPDHDEAQLRRVIFSSARRVIALLDHSKLGQITFAHVAPISAIHTLVTDDGADAGFLHELRERGIEVITCPVQRSST
jgi:DeoR family fructose operon transcriptional repressor